MTHGTRFCRASLTRTFELVDHVWALESVDDVFAVAVEEEARPAPRPAVLQACVRRAADLVELSL